jgi:transglutaminase-like putative cysteine protease
MHRRTLLASLGASALPLGAADLAAAQPTSSPEWRRYELTTTIDLTAQTGPARVWIPLTDSIGSYQRRLDRQVKSNGAARIVRDAHYGAPLLEVSWDADGPREITVVETLATRDRSADPVTLSAAEQRFWTQPVPSLPTDGIVGDTARTIVAGRRNPRERLRAIYDWVVDNTFRVAATRGCGIGGIEAMLRTGFLGGKCADINSLMVGLSRAAGIPARDAYGIRVGPSRFLKQLGASGDVTHAQHCRAEMWLAGEGWFPVDPADVRKAVLEASLPIYSPEVRALRERLFGNWEMNWVAYNHATDIVLPGAYRPIGEHFLMYPCAMTPTQELDQLSPDLFKYSIASRQLT